MEALITNSAFKHISDKMFLRLQVDDLLMCRSVCSSWKNFVDNFWFEKLLFVKDQVLTVAKEHVTELLQFIPPHTKKENELRKMLCAYLECFTLENKKDPISAIGSCKRPSPGK